MSKNTIKLLDSDYGKKISDDLKKDFLEKIEIENFDYMKYFFPKNSWNLFLKNREVFYLIKHCKDELITIIEKSKKEYQDLKNIANLYVENETALIVITLKIDLISELTDKLGFFSYESAIVELKNSLKEATDNSKLFYYLKKDSNNKYFSSKVIHSVSRKLRNSKNQIENIQQKMNSPELRPLNISEEKNSINHQLTAIIKFLHILNKQISFDNDLKKMLDKVVKETEKCIEDNKNLSIVNFNPEEEQQNIYMFKKNIDETTEILKEFFENFQKNQFDVKNEQKLIRLYGNEKQNSYDVFININKILFRLNQFYEFITENYDQSLLERAYEDVNCLKDQSLVLKGEIFNMYQKIQQKK